MWYSNVEKTVNEKLIFSSTQRNAMVHEWVALIWLKIEKKMSNVQIHLLRDQIRLLGVSIKVKISDELSTRKTWNYEDSKILRF